MAFNRSSQRQNVAIILSSMSFLLWGVKWVFPLNLEEEAHGFNKWQLGLCGKAYHHSSKASRREDLQVEEPVRCWDCSSFDFHPTVAGMLRAPLVGHQVIQVCQSRQKGLLTAARM